MTKEFPLEEEEMIPESEVISVTEEASTKITLSGIKASGKLKRKQ